MENTDNAGDGTRRTSSIWSTLAWAFGSFIVGVGVFIAVALFIQHSAAPTTPTIIAATSAPTPSSTTVPDAASPAPEVTDPDSDGALAACTAYAQALGTDITAGIDPLVNALQDAALQSADSKLRTLILAVADSYASNDLTPDTLTAVADYCNAGQ